MMLLFQEEMVKLDSSLLELQPFEGISWVTFTARPCKKFKFFHIIWSAKDSIVLTLALQFLLNQHLFWP